MNKKILIVDDEYMIRILLGKVLIKEGYEVLCASNGKIAIMNIEHEKFDLILLDLKLFGMDGIEVLERIRKIDKSIPVILMSGHLTHENIEKTTELGIFTYINKPFRLNEIKVNIKKALNIRS